MHERPLVGEPSSVRSRLAPLCSDVRGTGRRTYCRTAFDNNSSERFDCDISPRIGSTSPPSLVLVNTPARRQAAWPSEACPAVAVVGAPAHVLPEEHRAEPEKRHQSGKRPSQAEKHREWKRRQKPLHACRLRSAANDIWAETELGGQQRIGVLFNPCWLQLGDYLLPCVPRHLLFATSLIV